MPLKSHKPRRLWLFRIITLAIAIAASAMMAEVILRVVEKSKLGDATYADNFVWDPEFGHKLQAYTLGHDANGFRNPAVPKQADIVAIGNSLTWGKSFTTSAAADRRLQTFSAIRKMFFPTGGGTAVSITFAAGTMNLSYTLTERTPKSGDRKTQYLIHHGKIPMKSK
jgi:hypothetical protein